MPSYYRTPPKTSYAKRPRIAKTKRVMRSRRRDLSLPVVIPRPFPFAPILRCTMKYAERINITLGAGPSYLGSQLMAANGLYQPNLSVASHQPMCWDQLTQIYKKGAVVSSKIRYDIHPSAFTGTVVSWVDDDINILSGGALYPTAERPYSKSVVYSGATASGPVSLTNYFNNDAHFGKGSITDDAIQSSAAANPTELAVFALFANGVGAGTLIIDVYIEYFVQWSEFESIPAS